MKAVQTGSKKQRNIFRRLQECLLLVREVGNTKLEISARMLDKVSTVKFIKENDIYRVYYYARGAGTVVIG